MPTDNGERSTARGTVKLAIAQVVMAACGIATHIYLTRALQPQLYGLLAVVTSVIIWWEAVGEALVRNATTRFVAEAGEQWRPAASSAVRMTLAWGGLLVILGLLSAPLVSRMLGDPRLVPYLWLFSADLALFPLFITLAEVLAGRRRYTFYAGSWAIYWLAKAGLVIGLVAAGLSVHGAILGSILASVVGVVVAWWWSSAGLSRGAVPARKFIVFGLPLAGIALLRRTVQNMDLWAITRLLGGYNRVGYYGLAQYISRAMMMLPVAVCGAAFPTLTQAISRNDQPACRRLIRQSFRFALIAMVAALAVLGSSMSELIVLIFQADFAPASGPAIGLLVGGLLFAMEFVGTTVLVAAGKSGLCLAAFAPIVPVNILLNYVLVSRYEMWGGVTATVISAAIVAAIIIILVWREFRAVLAPPAVIRTLLAGGLIYLVGIHIPVTGWLVLLKCTGLAMGYGVVLIASGELTKADLVPLAFWRPGSPPTQ